MTSTAATVFNRPLKETVMQSGAIRKFELFYLAALGASLIVTILGLTNGTLLSSPAAQQVGTGIIIAGIAFDLLAWLALWYFTSRKRSNVARWIIVVFVALQAWRVVTAFSSITTLVGSLNLVVFALRAISTAFLFHPEARPWFSRGKAG